MPLNFEVAQASSETRAGADDMHQSDHYLTGKTGLGHAFKTRLPTSTPVEKGKHKSATAPDFYSAGLKHKYSRFALLKHSVDALRMIYSEATDTNMN